MRLDTGRAGQKLRTRQALLAAARRLMARGEPVTVIAAAAEAGISKATAYRYFTAPDALAMEAALDASVASPAEVVGDARDVRDRVRRVHRHLAEAVRRNERSFRIFLAKALEASAQGGAPMLRGGRRLPMYELALEPVRDRMSAEAFDALVNALAGATGLEAYLALRDVCQLGEEEAERVSLLAAEAILDSMLPAPPSRGDVSAG
ncbi:TetR family transcriptional regulator [Falsiroseomonas oryziterrae]|uniref:TetR family transcriptional regulator n=1 Tax=Falsiroseomonas oryziterrae TaxID=2911368 RepID=UPI001F385126|nr:TetR family transcriptional regulator [Roseomonas sp. NPKOSM-4]